MRTRDVAIIVVVAAVFTFFVVPPLHRALVWPLLEGKTFSSQFLWFDPIHAIYWAFTFIWSFVVGATVVALFPSSRFKAAALAGATAGLVRALATRAWISDDANWPTFVWVYGEYFIPLLGAVVGAAVMHRLPTRWRSRAT
jgi:hypothetical protein